MVSLATATRQHPQVAVGASPRAELDLVQLARARALLPGRDYVIPEDVKALAVPAIAHRISLRPEMWVRRMHGSDVVERTAAPAAGTADARQVTVRWNETRETDAEFRWGASPLTRAVATCAAVALAAAVFGARWQLIAFAAPLLGVLCSIGWQRPVPTVRCYAARVGSVSSKPSRCELSVWATADADVALGRSAWTRKDLAVADLADGSQSLSRRWRHSCRAEASRWGRYPSGLASKCVAAGGLLRGTATVDAADCCVFPVAPPQSTGIPRTELPDRLGTHLTRHIGPGVEFADIRAYVPGDQLRAVNWPVSARRGACTSPSG